MRTLLAFAALLLASCSRPAAPPPEPPAPLHHVVLFTLKDAAEVPALLRDCDAVGALPGARGASAGTRLDVGRAEAAGAWNVAFHVAFADAAAYGAWREHPRHREVIAAWVPKIAEIAVHDWTDPTP
jgi:hypothetical protein